MGGEEEDGMQLGMKERDDGVIHHTNNTKH